MTSTPSQPGVWPLWWPIALASVLAIGLLTVVSIVSDPKALLGLVVLKVVLGLAFASAAAGVAWFALRRWVGGLGALRERIEELASGKPVAGGEAADVVKWLGLDAAFKQVGRNVESLRNRLAESNRQVTEARNRLEDTQRLLSSGGGGTKTGEQSFSGTVLGDPLETTVEMLNRLSPELLWIGSSQPEAELLGWPAEELVGRGYLEVVHPEDRAEVKKAFKKCLSLSEAHDIVYRVVSRTKEVRHVQTDAAARFDADGKCIAIRCHVQDITEQVKAREELRQRTEQLAEANMKLAETNEELRRSYAQVERLKDRYSDLYHHSPVMYYSLDAEGRFVACNDTMIERLGYRREELVGKPYEVLLTSPMRKVFPETFDDFKRAKRLELETQWRTASGEVIDVLVQSTAIEDAQGKFLRGRSVAQDITQEKRLREQLREEAEKLARANRRLQAVNEELDDFTYVISHDLKEPLRTIDAFSRFLIKDYHQKLDTEGREYLDYLSEASVRLKEMIDEVLELSRIGRVGSTPSPVRIEEVLARIRQDLHEAISQQGTELNVRGPLPDVFADRTRVSQVFANLISNAIKYNDSGSPTVEVGVLSEGQVVLEPDAPPEDLEADGAGSVGDGYRVFYVRDNGIGIAREHLDRVFRLFQRLHRRDEYEGTGAGLTICKKIVEAYGGRLWLQSEAGRGTTFYVSLPMAKAEVGGPQE